MWDSVGLCRAHAGLHPLLRGDCTCRWCPEVYCSDASERGWSFAVRTAQISFFARHGRVPERSRFRGPSSSGRAQDHTYRQLGLAESGPADDIPDLEHEQVSNFPDICAELLSVNTWNIVDYSRFMRDEDTFPLEARSSLRAVQSACERHQNLVNPFPALQFGAGSVVDQGQSAVFSCSCGYLSNLIGRTRCKLLLMLSVGAVRGAPQRPWVTILRCRLRSVLMFAQKSAYFQTTLSAITCPSSDTVIFSCKNITVLVHTHAQQQKHQSHVRHRPFCQ